MKKLTTSCFLLAILSLITIRVQAQTATALFDQTLADIYANNPLTGFSVTVVNKDKILYQNALGYADIANKNHTLHRPYNIFEMHPLFPYLLFYFVHLKKDELTRFFPKSNAFAPNFDLVINSEQNIYSPDCKKYIMKKKLIIICCFLGIFLHVNAQEKAVIKQNFPLNISILDESTSLPNFWFLRYSYNPAIMVGTEYILKQKATSDFHLTGNVGYYYHKDWASTLFILPEIGYRYHLKRWSFYARFGVGYSHSFATKPIYKFDDGEFRETNDLGNPAAMISLSLNTSFKLSDKALAPEIYVTLMSSAELPFNDYTGLHQFAGVGYKFYPFKQ